MGEYGRPVPSASSSNIVSDLGNRPNMQRLTSYTTPRYIASAMRSNNELSTQKNLYPRYPQSCLDSQHLQQNLSRLYSPILMH